MPRKVIGIFGAGGHGKETLTILQDRKWLSQNPFFRNADVVFIESAPNSSYLRGIPILSESDYFQLNCNKKFVTLALGDPNDREIVAERFLNSNIQNLNVVSTEAHVDRTAKIGHGALISPFAFISTDVVIGSFFQANVNTSVSHDCVIGNFVTLSPGVICNGNVQIGNNVFIGSGAVIRNGTKNAKIVIGDNVIIGMGSVVTKDVPADWTVIGNPARLME